MLLPLIFQGGLSCYVLLIFLSNFTKIHLWTHLQAACDKVRNSSCFEQPKICPGNTCTGEVLRFLTGGKAGNIVRYSYIRIQACNDSIQTARSYFWASFLLLSQRKLVRVCSRGTILGRSSGMNSAGRGFVASLPFKNHSSSTRSS